MEQLALDIIKLTLEKEFLGVNFKKLFDQKSSDEIKEFIIAFTLEISKRFLKEILK